MAVPVKTILPGNRRTDSFTYRPFEPKGNIFYVHNSGSGGTTGGRTPDEAVTTIDAAINLCTADNDDEIRVLAGHTEALTGAAAVALDVAGVTITGEGVGRRRPIITYTTAAGASFDVTAARCVVRNLVFTMIGVDAITAGINVSGADFVLQDCEIEFADATNQATLALLTAATATRMQILNNWFHGSANAGTAAAIRHAVGADCVIKGNVIAGNFTTSLGGIDNTAAVTNLIIDGNTIWNETASSTVAVNCHGSTTGSVTNNRLGVLMGTAPIVGAALYLVGGNYYKAAAGVAAGTLL